MHANDDQRVRILILQPLQVRNDMDAVDTAEGPEVEQDDLAAQVTRERKRALGIEPVHSNREIRHWDRAGIGIGFGWDRIVHRRSW